MVNSPQPTGPAASSPTYGQWAVFSVSAPLANAFQDAGNKESVLKVQSTGGKSTVRQVVSMKLSRSRGRVGRPDRRVLGWSSTICIPESKRYEHRVAQARVDCLVW